MKRLLLWLKLPFVLRRAYRVIESEDQTQSFLAKKSYADALQAAWKAIDLGQDRFYKTRIFEGSALFGLGQIENSGAAFARAIELIETDSKLNNYEKDYLRLYCYSFFRDVAWPSALEKEKSKTFPEMPDLSFVSPEIARRHPFSPDQDKERLSLH